MAGRADDDPWIHATRAEVDIDVDGGRVRGDLVVPAEARGIVVFAHGSGSSRHSERNRSVAAGLESGGLATLLMDLLTVEEERHERSGAARRFDIALLAGRLGRAIDWAGHHEACRGLPLGLFGASTGAAAALVAAAHRRDEVAAVVSRGGRPDLAGDDLADVLAPTLLIVGGADREVLALNDHAAQTMVCDRQVEVVAGATHLFEEAGTLEQVTDLARRWFTVHLGPGGTTR